MLSVKHITLSGEETIYPTERTNYVPGSVADAQSAGSPPHPDTLWIFSPTASAYPLTGGTAFVMNELGKTVSRYDLGASMVPL